MLATISHWVVLRPLSLGAVPGSWAGSWPGSGAGSGAGSGGAALFAILASASANAFFCCSLACLVLSATNFQAATRLGFFKCGAVVGVGDVACCVISTGSSDCSVDMVSYVFMKKKEFKTKLLGICRQFLSSC